MCVCASAAGDARTSAGAHGVPSGFSQGESLSCGCSDFEEEGSWDDEDTAGGGSVASTAGSGLITEGVEEEEADEDVDKTGDGEEVEDELGAAEAEHGVVTAGGDKREEDLEMGDFEAEEVEPVLEDVGRLSE